MEFSSKKQALLYLDRNGFYYYELGFPTVQSLAFSESSVKDLDLVDEKSLDNQIQGFLAQNKLSTSIISMIISPNIIFEKDIYTIDPIQQKEEIDKFINTVPFANVSTENFPIDKGVKAIGVNEDLFLAIKNSFEKLGCVASLILPYHALGADASLLSSFTTNNLSQLLRKLDHFKEFNLLRLKILDTPATSTAPAQTTQTNAKSNMRVFIMAGALLVLVGIMIYMLLTFK